MLDGQLISEFQATECIVICLGAFTLLTYLMIPPEVLDSKSFLNSIVLRTSSSVHVDICATFVSSIMH